MLIELTSLYTRIDSTSLLGALGIVILRRDAADKVEALDEDDGVVTLFDEDKNRQLHLLRPINGRRVGVFRVGTTVRQEHNTRIKLTMRRSGSITLMQQRDERWEASLSLIEHLSSGDAAVKIVTALSDYDPRFTLQEGRTAWNRLLDSDPFDDT